MKALVYHGAREVRIDDKPKPKIEDKEDIILRVTSTALWVRITSVSWHSSGYEARTNIRDTSLWA